MKNPTGERCWPLIAILTGERPPMVLMPCLNLTWNGWRSNEATA